MGSFCWRLEEQEQHTRGRFLHKILIIREGVGQEAGLSGLKQLDLLVDEKPNGGSFQQSLALISQVDSVATLVAASPLSQTLCQGLPDDPQLLSSVVCISIF